jgi:hypothetical protein
MARGGHGSNLKSIDICQKCSTEIDKLLRDLKEKKREGKIICIKAGKED